MRTGLSDMDLLRQMARGNEQAFEVLFRNWYGPLVVYAYRFLRDKMEAENVVQVVFITVWEKRRELKIKDLKNYLKVAVRNRCMNHLRRQKHFSSVDERLLVSFDDRDEELPERDLLDRIYKAIEQMPSRRKKVFKMGRFEGLKYKEIASLMKISPKTVEVQMSKALKYLRDLFADADYKKTASK